VSAETPRITFSALESFLPQVPRLRASTTCCMYVCIYACVATSCHKCRDWEHPPHAVCMYVRIYVCMYVGKYPCVCVCMHAWQLRAAKAAIESIVSNLSNFVCIHIMCTYTHTYVHTYLTGGTYVYTYIHTYTHTYIPYRRHQLYPASLSQIALVSGFLYMHTYIHTYIYIHAYFKGGLNPI
jgi:hypothetical protein